MPDWIQDADLVELEVEELVDRSQSALDAQRSVLSSQGTRSKGPNLDGKIILELDNDLLVSARVDTRWSALNSLVVTFVCEPT